MASAFFCVALCTFAVGGTFASEPDHLDFHTCVRDTGATCSEEDDHCPAEHAADCVQGRCTCRPGWCAINGFCLDRCEHRVGSCNMFPCFAWRGPDVDCEGTVQQECLCREGFCAMPNGECRSWRLPFATDFNMTELSPRLEVNHRRFPGMSVTRFGMAAVILVIITWVIHYVFVHYYGSRSFAPACPNQVGLMPLDFRSSSREQLLPGYLTEGLLSSPPRQPSTPCPGFILPESVSEEVFSTLLEYCSKLSRNFNESKKLAKAIAVGNPKELRKHCQPMPGTDWSEASTGVQPLSFEYLKTLAQFDGGLAVDGKTCQLLGKVKFDGDQDFVPGANFRGGIRHFSSYVLARTLDLSRGGLCMVVSEGGAVMEVKVFLGGVVYLYDSLEKQWSTDYSDALP
eukprot:TRINITY_DN42302_c0_g1_i1.p1 TRINITY_DN42302_c0_g1~~TRINITY_DN42302_c0_g1_i1.p1  ORF type:complete len:433 (-),score=47.46 TRINITY_DN42302_c0_g1_i1:101-1300(-)